MLTTKEIINSITSVSTYFKTLFFLGFIWLVSYFLSKLVEIPINYIWFVVVFVLALIGTYLATSPLLIDYKEVLGKMANNTRILQSELKKEQAKCNLILADLNSLETIYEKEKANAKQIVNELSELRMLVSELQNENNELKATDNRELANLKQRISEFSKVQEELRTKTIQLSRLQRAEQFMFLVELQITPQQVANSITNAINAKKYNSPEHKEEMLKLLDSIKNSKIIHV